MGFCLFNNVAVAAAHALAACGAERVLILDWDVHHGNGTEAIFADSDRVLYASIHQWPLYPGTGAAEFTGEGAGEGLHGEHAGAAGLGLDRVPVARAARGRADSRRLSARTWSRSPPATTPTATTRSPTAGWRPRPTATWPRRCERRRRSWAPRCSSASKAATTGRRWRPRCWPRSRPSVASRQGLRRARRARPPVHRAPARALAARLGAGYAGFGDRLAASGDRLLVSRRRHGAG